MHKRWSGAPGQALVEMTLALGVLILLIFGSICAVQWAMASYSVTQAARAAAHQAALLGGDDGPQGTVVAAARQALAGGIGMRSERATVVVTCATTPCRRYTLITVRVRYEDGFWAPIGPFSELRTEATATRAAERDQQ